jgi:antitoxin HigA-1
VVIAEAAPVGYLAHKRQIGLIRQRAAAHRLGPISGRSMSDAMMKVGMRPPYPGGFIRGEIWDEFGLTVARAAEILSVRRATLSDLVNGRASLSPEMALRIEKAFGVYDLAIVPTKARGATSAPALLLHHVLDHADHQGQHRAARASADHLADQRPMLRPPAAGAAPSAVAMPGSPIPIAARICPRIRPPTAPPIELPAVPRL